jgi:hypothetical protein
VIDLVHQIAEYGVDLEHFMSEESLPPEWFDHPDYLAVNTVNRGSFDELMESLKSGELAKEKNISFTVVGELPFSKAFLFGELAVVSGWGIDLVNVAGPRHGEDNYKDVEVNHVGFYWPGGLKVISDHVRSSADITAEYEPDSGHTGLKVPFEAGTNERKVKFVSRRLSSIVTAELLSGEAEVIYEAGK